MQRLTYVVFINLAYYYGKRRCQPSRWSTRDFACALVLFPDQWVWYLAWERKCMCACIQNQKMASFTMGSSCGVLEDLGFGSVEAIKTLSIRGSAH